MTKKVFFTDLDGTLLNQDTYSFEDAKPALSVLKKNKIPLIICTSKTRAEIEVYRKKLKNNHPFISENGGAIFIPNNYFSFQFNYDKKLKNYHVIELGEQYIKLKKVLNKLKKKFKVIGFSDMTYKQISKDSGLKLNEAKLAKKREYDEAFKIIDKKNERKIEKMIKSLGFNSTTGGMYAHIMGNSDKGKAVKILIKLYRIEFGKEKFKTISLGDSKNDFLMLENTNASYLVQKKDRTYASQKYKKAKNIGPIGWNNAVLKEFKNLK